MGTSQARHVITEAAFPACDLRSAKLRWTCSLQYQLRCDGCYLEAVIDELALIDLLMATIA